MEIKENGMQKLIYIADDEENIRLMMQTFLESEGYLVRTFENGRGIRQAAAKKKPDMIHSGHYDAWRERA